MEGGGGVVFEGWGNTIPRLGTESIQLAQSHRERERLGIFKSGRRTMGQTSAAYQAFMAFLFQMTVSDYCSEEDSEFSSDVANLVDFIWNEATGSLSNILAVPVDAIKLEDVEKAEAILLLLRKSLDASEDVGAVENLSDEFFSVIPHKKKGTGITSKQAIAQKQDLCQVRQCYLERFSIHCRKTKTKVRLG